MARRSNDSCDSPTSARFSGGFLLVFGLNLFVVDLLESRRQDARKRLEKELRQKYRDKARSSVENKELAELAFQGGMNLSSHQTLAERMRTYVDQSGVAIKTSQLVLLTIVFASLPAILIGIVYPNWMLVVLTAICFGSLPSLYVLILRQRRQQKLRGQLADAFEMMSRVLRSGQTISQSIQAVADEFSPPIAEEFAFCYEQQNLGLSPEAAMRQLAQRTGLLEIRIFVVAVMVHRQTGGNLSELLDKISHVIRERFRISGHIRALTAEGRLQAIVLLALPPLMIFLLLALNRDYMMTLFKYPSILIVMFVCEILGALWMRKIVNFEI